jgi:hypothetical protein
MLCHGDARGEPGAQKARRKLQRGTGPGDRRPFDEDRPDQRPKRQCRGGQKEIGPAKRDATGGTEATRVLGKCLCAMTPRRRSATNTSNLRDVCNITATFSPFLVSICDKSCWRPATADLIASRESECLAPPPHALESRGWLANGLDLRPYPLGEFAAGIDLT